MKCFRFQAWIAFFVSLFLLPIHFVFAMDLSSMYVTSTTHLTSASANYKFVFVLASSATWSEGESMTITFPSGYALTSFTEDDVDIADDGVDLTTAANCSGSEHMGISISGTVVTFEMCAGDGGTIASSSSVEIEMGLSASSSGSGTRQVTNPSGVGSYFIAFGGTFGSIGSLVVPIISSSGPGVTAQVPTATTTLCTVNCSAGGGGGLAGRDDTSEDEESEEDEVIEEDVEEETTDEVLGDEETGGNEEPGGGEADGETDGSSDVVDDSSGGDAGGSERTDSDNDNAGDDGEDISYDVGVSAEEVVLPVIDHTVQVLSETSPSVQILLEGGDATAVYIEIGDEIYPFTEIAEDVWQGDVTVGGTNVVGSIIIEDDSGVVVTSPLSFDVISSGAVYEIVEGSSVGVEDAVVTVLRLDESVWNAEEYGQSASFVTNEQGSGFAWYVPNGTYILYVEKEGYETSRTTVTVTRGILAPTLFVLRSDEEVIIGEESDGGETRVEEEILPEKSFEETVFAPVVAVLGGIVEFFQDATPEEVATVATPVAVATATIAVVAAGGGQFWLLLYSFFSQPLLFFARRKHKKMGVVYNSVTKVPLELVTVRAFDVKTGKLVKTVVTNDRGQFFLRLSQEGVYRLQATKQEFVFPSTYLDDVREDGAYTDVYAGQPIDVLRDADAVTVAIPLDPQGSLVPAKVLRWQRTKRRIALVFSPLSAFVALGVLVIYPGVFTTVLFSAQVLLYFFTWKVTHRKRRSSWGIVYDEQTRRPVGNVMIRLFEPKYNKLVESLLSDANGRYVFALGPNEYYVTFAKDGYQEATVKPIDYKTRKEISLFGIHLPLRRHKGT